MRFLKGTVSAAGLAALLASLGSGILPAQKQAPESRAARRQSELRILNYDIRESARTAGLRETRPERQASALEARFGTGSRALFSEEGRLRSLTGGLSALSRPLGLPAEETARRLVADLAPAIGLAPESQAELAVGANVLASGDSSGLVSFRQKVNGIPVFEGRIDVTLDAAGQIWLVTAGDVLASADGIERPRLSAEESVRRAVQVAGGGELPLTELPAPTPGAVRFQNPFSPGNSPVWAELFIFPVRPDQGRAAWRSYVEVDGARLFEIVIDAGDGSLLYRQNLVRQAGRGRVWRESPLKGDRELVDFPDAWLAPGVDRTTGNNVDAYLDADGNNLPDLITAHTNLSGGRAYSISQDFDFPAGDGSSQKDPRLTPAASIVNLFYHINQAHDFFYGLGFDEVSWNFQTNNFNKGGLGGDAILVEAQDPQFANNAAMQITPDGRAPRMQVGLALMNSSSRVDDRDLAYDGGIILHEYAHGVTDRMTGRGVDTGCLSGLQAGAMAEGWSDYFAASYFNNPVIGAYASAELQRGFRRFSYANYPFNYSDLGRGTLGYEVHDDGEIWAAVLWDLRAAIGTRVADRLVVLALRSTPCRPTMVQARDAILTADQASNKGANRRAIWEAFAKRGLGSSACGIEGSTFAGIVHQAAFDLPADLEPGPRGPAVGCPARAVAPVAFGGQFRYQIPVESSQLPLLQFALTSGPPGLAVDQAGLVTWTAGFTGKRFQVTITGAQGQRVIHTAWIPVDTPLDSGKTFTISATEGEMGFATIRAPEGATLLRTTLRGGTGDADLYLLDPDLRTSGVSTWTGHSNETLGVSRPRAGVWRIMVDAWSAYSGVALLADLSDPAFLPPTHTIASLTDVEGGEAYYKLTVPKGAESLRIQTAGGTGDADLYVRRGQPSVCRLIGSGSSWFWSCPHDFRSFNDGNAESVVIQNPQEGDYYVTVHGYEKYAGLTLTTAMQSPLTMLLSANTLAFAGLEGAAMTARSLTIAEAGGRAFTWTARTDSAATAAWLRLSAASGSNLSTLTVTPASAALAPGVYRGRITITASVPASGLESAPPVAGSPQEVAVTLTVGARPRLAASVQQLAFRGQPGTDPAAQTFTVSNAGGGALNWTAAVLPEPPAPWLLVNPSSGTGDGRVQVSVRSSSLSPGRYSGVIRVTATDALTALDIRVTLDQFVPVTVQSLRNAANPEMNWGISPGSRIILTGTDFHPACSLAEGAATPCPKALSAPPPTELSVTRVTFNGKPGQLWQVTPTQIDVAPPMTVTGPEASIVVYNGLSASAPFITAVVDQALGLFTAYSTSGGAGFVRHPSGSFVSRAEPLVANEIIEIVATGLGKVGEDRKSLIPVRVFLDGSEAEVVWAGLSEYEGGLYRVLTRVPEGLARRYPLVSVISDIAGSNTVSAGGPTIAEVLPRNVAAGVEVVVQLKGYNFAGSSAVRIGETVIPAAFEDGPVQTLTVTLPAALLTAGTLELVVVDRLALDEAPSNPATLTVRP